MRLQKFWMATCLTTIAVATPLVAADRKQEVRMRKFAVAYAKCVVRESHDRASAAVLSTSNNTEVMSRFRELVSPDCLEAAAGLGVDARFPAGTMQSALADALVNADFATHGEVSFANRLPLAQLLPMTEAEKTEALAKAKSKRARDAAQLAAELHAFHAWLGRYGECVVRQDPEAARFWLLTPPDTPEETSRIKALQPAFGACLGGGTMKFNRVTMRSTVALNYYRLAMATVVPGARSNP